MKPKIPVMTNRASQSIQVEMTIGFFIAIILGLDAVGSVLRYNDDKQQIYHTIDAMMHINEKDMIECKACARFPMAQSDISVKKSLLMITSYKKIPHTSCWGTQNSNQSNPWEYLSLNFCKMDMKMHPTAINLSTWVPFSTTFKFVGVISWPLASVTGTGTSEPGWLAEPKMAAGN